MPKMISRSDHRAAQLAFAKAAEAEIAPELIEGCEQDRLAEKTIADAKQPCRDHEKRSVRAARPPPPRLHVWLLSKRDVLDIVGVSYPTLWAMMRANKFPRSRKVGGQSKWVSTEVAAWLAALPKCRLKGDPLPDDKPSEVTSAPHIE
jgi:predicted DNA-binding transcriptional regulator AlpA